MRLINTFAPIRMYSLDMITPVQIQNKIKEFTSNVANKGKTTSLFKR